MCMYVKHVMVIIHGRITMCSIYHCPYLRPTRLKAKASSMYTESIEKLKAVLSAMQNMSDKRGRLEKRLRQELKTEIQTLREGRREGAAGSGEQAGEELKQKLGEQQVEIAALEADVAKVSDTSYTDFIFHSFCISFSCSALVYSGSRNAWNWLQTRKWPWTLQLFPGLAK